MGSLPSSYRTRRWPRLTAPASLKLAKVVGERGQHHFRARWQRSLFELTAPASDLVEGTAGRGCSCFGRRLCDALASGLVEGALRPQCGFRHCRTSYGLRKGWVALRASRAPDVRRAFGMRKTLSQQVYKILFAVTNLKGSTLEEPLRKDGMMSDVLVARLGAFLSRMASISRWSWRSGRPQSTKRLETFTICLTRDRLSQAFDRS